MKIKDAGKPKRNPGRILLYALLALAVLAVGALPLYRALSQNKVEALAPTTAALNSLPTRLQVNPSGSVRVSFQGQPGARHQIFYADKLPTSTDKEAWTLVADDIAAGSGEWTVWLDTSAATRSRPAGAKQGFYRVMVKSAAAVKSATVTLATSSSTDSTSTNAYAALKAMRKRETADILNIIAGGPETQATLVQKLAETPLTAEYILELLKHVTPEQQWARTPILEAAVGTRAGQLKVKALARTRLLLGAEYFSADRHPEAIEQFLEVTRIDSDTRQTCEALVMAGRVYQAQRNKPEARRYLLQAAQFSNAGRWPEEAQLILGQTSLGERDAARALEEFRKLAEWPEGGMFRAHAHFYMGEALRQMERWEDAYAEYRKVIAMNRDLPRKSPYRSQYNTVEKWARFSWTQIAPHLQSSGSTNTQVVAPKSETNP